MVVNVRGLFRPVLKAIIEIKEKWKHWNWTLGNERAIRVTVCFGKLTRDHLFWICNPEQCWSVQVHLKERKVARKVARKKEYDLVVESITWKIVLNTIV